MPDKKKSAALHSDSLMEKDFKRISEFIYDKVGIKLPPAKKTMIEARLHKRMRALGMPDLGSYVSFVFSPRGMEEELTSLINVITTNTTDFFREPQHFEILNTRILPEWMGWRNRKSRLKLWSAGCSIGMEPYTLTMVMQDFAERNQGFDYEILATDISTHALQTGIKAVYDEERVRPVPAAMKKKYLLRSKDRSKRLVRIDPMLRRKVIFRQLNFMESFSFPEPMDIVFCRNVVIYFDKVTQATLFRKFCEVIKPNGWLFIGHSESITSFDLPLKQLAPTVYKRI